MVRQFTADALGRMRVKEAAGLIAAQIVTKDATDEDLATFSANALVFIGDRAQAKSLLKAGQAGAIRPRLAVLQALALLGEPLLKKELLALAVKEKKGQPKECAREVQEMLGSPAVEEKGSCEKLGDTLAGYGVALDAAEACEKDPAGCWTEKLADKEPLVRARAAYELGRTQATSAVPALVKLCGDGELPARLAAIRALEWLAATPAAKGPLKAAVPALAKQLEGEQGRVQYLKVNEELKRLHWKLSRL